MNDPQQEDQLASLWQQQSTPEIDPAVLRKTIHKMRLKQALYGFFDFFSVIVCWIMLVVYRDSMSTLVFYSVLVITLVAFGFSFYLLYLRRFALFKQSESTADYMLILKRQTQSNIKIAKFTQHSCWLSFLFIVVVWSLIGISGEFSFEVWRRKALISVGLGVVLLLPFWFWAKRRAEKFRLEFDRLQKQEDNGSNSE